VGLDAAAGFFLADVNFFALAFHVMPPGFRVERTIIRQGRAGV